MRNLVRPAVLVHRMLRVFALAATMAIAVSSPASAALVYERLDNHDDAKHAIVAAHDDGTGAHTIAHGFNPYLTPNGQRVAYFEPSANGSGLYTIGLSGRHRRLIAKGVYDGVAPQDLAWSPDNEDVLVAPSVGPGAYLVDIPTGKRRRIPLDGNLATASYAPAGDRLALESQYGDFGGEVFLVEADSLHQRSLGDGLRPVWGLSGLAFERSAAGATGSVIYLLRRPDGQPTPLVSSATSQIFPVGWSADGKTLLIGRFAGASLRARLFDIEHNTATHLPGEFSEIYDVSRDGHQVLAQRDGKNLVAVRADGTGRVLAHGARHATWTK